MIKTLIAAIVSALTATLITKHYADKRTIALHRSYDRKLDTMRHDAFSDGWDCGKRYGYRQGHMHGTIGHTED